MDLIPPDERWKLPDRVVLLTAARWFIDKAKELNDVLQIALIGSLCTEKKNPKDVDVLLTLKSGADFKQTATLARKMQGRIQKGSLGSDVFIVQDGVYVGRACHYREPWLRVVCGSRHLICAQGMKYLCDTSANFRLKPELISKPPLVLWPSIAINTQLPQDVMECFGLLHG